MSQTVFARSDPYFVYRPLLDLIGKSEGTDKGRGYNETLDYGAYTGGDVELVKMTLDEIDALQTKMLVHPKNRRNSSALGRYQIVRTTLRRIKKALGLTGKERYDAHMQDRMACFLLGSRGIDQWLAGEMSEDALINALAKEWASLPTTSGKSYYSGQRASVTVAEVREVLAEVRLRAEGKVQSQGRAGLITAIISGLIALGVWLANLPCNLIGVFCGG